MEHFAAEDILHIVIQPGKESGTEEISPNITAELNADGELIGVEILDANTYIRDAVLESVQAKLLSRK